MLHCIAQCIAAKLTSKAISKWISKALRHFFLPFILFNLLDNLTSFVSSVRIELTEVNCSKLLGHFREHWPRRKSALGNGISGTLPTQHTWQRVKTTDRNAIFEAIHLSISTLRQPKLGHCYILHRNEFRMISICEPKLQKYNGHTSTSCPRVTRRL